MIGINPLVSIIIPTFNRAGLIKETIQSVINQGYPNWECIVIDDGSEDNTLEMVRDVAGSDARIMVTQNQRRKGAQGARNTGVERATGVYFIFLDSDDLLGEHCLGIRVARFQQFPDNDFLVFSTVEFKKNIGDTNILLNVPTKEDELLRFLNMDVPWLTTGPIWKRQSFIKLGMWNEDFLSWHDWEMHVRALLNHYKFIYYSEVDNYWRCDDGIASIGKDSTNRNHLESHLRLLTSLKPLLANSPMYIAKLNGLIFWIGEKALEKGWTDLAILSMKDSHANLHSIKKMMNYGAIKILKKQLIKYPQPPNFGTLRKVVYNTGQCLK